MDQLKAFVFYWSNPDHGEDKDGSVSYHIHNCVVLAKNARQARVFFRQDEKSRKNRLRQEMAKSKPANEVEAMLTKMFAKGNGQIHVKEFALKEGLAISC